MGTLREVCQKLDSLIRRFDAFETWKSTIESRLVTLETAMNHHTPITQPIDLDVQNFVTEHFAEEKRIQSKKLNIVVYGVQEDDSGDCEKDKVFVKDILLACQDSDNIQQKLFRRLGKNINATERPRPILLVMNLLEDKKLIMKTKVNLKSKADYKDIYLSHALTWKQRDQRKQYFINQVPADSTNPNALPPKPHIKNAEPITPIPQNIRQSKNVTMRDRSQPKSSQ